MTSGLALAAVSLACFFVAGCVTPSHNTCKQSTEQKGYAV